MGSISFGIAFVAGRNRVPSPAAGMTAAVTPVMGHETTRSTPCPTNLSGARPIAITSR